MPSIMGQDSICAKTLNAKTKISAIVRLQLPPSAFASKRCRRFQQPSPTHAAKWSGFELNRCLFWIISPFTAGLIFQNHMDATIAIRLGLPDVILNTYIRVISKRFKVSFKKDYVRYVPHDRAAATNVLHGG